MILVCPVRDGDKNEELRHALRSWETNLAGGPHELVVIGHKPYWLSPDHYVEGNLYASAPLSVWGNINIAAGLLADTPEVVFMNDDFFCMNPVESVQPVKRNITLAQHIGMFPRGAGGWWPKSLRLTASLLAEAGYPSPDSYEVHRPLLCKPAGMLSALSTWTGGTKDGVPQWRTLYGVLNEVEAEAVPDGKLGLPGTDRNSAWVSTSDHSWRSYAVMIQRSFQKPSRWEQ